MRTFRIALAVAALTMLCATGAMASKYYVYCANGKIEIDQRDLKQMKSARGSHTYQIFESDNRIDAEKVAKQFGGVGKQCPKR